MLVGKWTDVLDLGHGFLQDRHIQMSRVAGALPLKQVVSLVPESLTSLKPVVY